MTDSPEFVAYVAAHLTELGALQTRAIFGGTGILLDNRLVGVVLDGRLYLHTNEQNRADYTVRGMGPLRPYPNAFDLTTDQYEVPDEIVRDGTQLKEWGRRALQASIDAARAKQLAGIERSRKAKQAKKKST